MEAVETFLNMGGYAAFVWSAYGVAVAVLCGLIVISVRQLRAREREAAAIESEYPRRARRGTATGDTPDEA